MRSINRTSALIPAALGQVLHNQRLKDLGRVRQAHSQVREQQEEHKELELKPILLREPEQPDEPEKEDKPEKADTPEKEEKQKQPEEKEKEPKA